MEWTQGMLEQARAAASPAALLSLAREQGVELTEPQAAQAFARLHPPAGALADTELADVSGGGCGESPQEPKVCATGRAIGHRCSVCGYDCWSPYPYNSGPREKLWACRVCIVQGRHDSPKVNQPGSDDSFPYVKLWL